MRVPEDGDDGKIVSDGVVCSSEHPQRWQDGPIDHSVGDTDAGTLLDGNALAVSTVHRHVRDRAVGVLQVVEEDPRAQVVLPVVPHLHMADQCRPAEAALVSARALILAGAVRKIFRVRRDQQGHAILIRWPNAILWAGHRGLAVLTNAIATDRVRGCSWLLGIPGLVRCSLSFAGPADHNVARQQTDPCPHSHVPGPVRLNISGVMIVLQRRLDFNNHRLRPPDRQNASVSAGHCRRQEDTSDSTWKWTPHGPHQPDACRSPREPAQSLIQAPSPQGRRL
eukprot:2433660-Rhodomonas_salina.2